MLFLRLLGKMLLFAAFVAFAYDGTRTLANPGQGLLVTSLSAHLRHTPEAWESLESFFANYAPSFLWNGIVEPMLALPVSLLFGAAGALFFLAGYRRPPLELRQG